jgi:hypothetical protein
MISSLVNVSNGGENETLTANLESLSQTLRSLWRFGTCHLAFTVLNDSNYGSGVWISWGENVGVSSVYANFTLEIYTLTKNVELDYAFNITTSLTLAGYYSSLAGGEKLVTLTCKVYNEGEPALARNMSVFYKNDGSWMLVNSSNNPSMTDYGNGTYVLSFTVEVLSNVIQVSAHVHDTRGILVQANTTCYEV